MLDETGKPDALELAKEALEKTDPDKFPKLYQAREQTVKAMEDYRQQEDRAKLAEVKAREKYERKLSGEETPKTSEGEKTPTKSDLSQMDLYALMQAKVPQRAISEIVDFARFKDISVAEALKNKYVQSRLSDMEEEQKSAEASNVAGGRRGITKVSGEDLLKRASKTGELPESDEDFSKLAEARYTRKPKQ